MATNTSTGTAESNLLTSSEQSVCSRVAKGEAPHKQRALALLAINSGKSSAEAAEESGLSLGQVRYWLGRFRKLGLDIFAVEPAKKPTEAAKVEKSPEQEAVSTDAVESAPETGKDVESGKPKKVKAKKQKKEKKPKDKKKGKEKKKKDGKKKKQKKAKGKKGKKSDKS
jgi:hypothetical protein